MRKIIFAVLISVLASLQPVLAQAYLYTIKGQVNLRSGPGTSHKILQRLDMNQTLKPLDKKGRWHKVATIAGRVGYIRDDLVSDTWLKLHKKERTLFLIKGTRVLESFRVGLSFNPMGDKERLGDGGTPEGRFYLCEMIKHPTKAKYGARSMRLSYPNIEDARRGLASGMISYAAYRGIVKTSKQGRMPSQRTRLGGSIRIHGGGNSADWTAGCVGMADRDIIKLWKRVRRGIRVEVYKSAAQEAIISSSSLLGHKILSGAKAQLENPALYTAGAAGLIKLKYPMGDINPEDAVCTDIVIRALRVAGLDLQALVHEDILTHPERYRRWIKQPNFHIDHRRTRNLQIWFSHNAQTLEKHYSPAQRYQFAPGDIVTMDTGIANGTIYDHIGIVDDAMGKPGVINIWNTGMRTQTMDLLGNSYPLAVGHFRLGHPFDYQ